jgi:hypothetical protein
VRIKKRKAAESDEEEETKQAPLMLDDEKVKHLMT